MAEATKRGVANMMLLRVVMVLAVLLAGAAAPAAAAGTGSEPHVIVAVSDSGVNPYHEIYYRPQNTAHPCTWVAGFSDCSIPALDLSIGEFDSVADALAADREVWDSVVQDQWYWIPKTNIIGAVCDMPYDGFDPEDPAAEPDAPTCILDDNGHGTGTTSSVLSEAPDALLLVHEGDGTKNAMWNVPVVPDIQSHSWGGHTPLPAHATDPVAPGDDACTDQVEPETIFFISAGNETPMPSIADCDKGALGVQTVGGAFPGQGHARSWSTYDFASWFCRPTAAHDKTTGPRDDVYCGTSFSAPTVAGTAAAALLRIRQHEGYTGRNTVDSVSASVTREQFVQALRDGATYTPEAKFRTPTAVFDEDGTGRFPLPEQAPWTVWGYGWLDSTVTDAVVSCALGQTCPAKPAEATQYNDARQRARAVQREDVAPSVSSANDAGSGRDAGESIRTAVPVEPGTTYSARLDTYGHSGDMRDRFLFPARAGEAFDISVDAQLACWVLWDTNGALHGGECAASPGTPAPTAAPRDGTYVLDVYLPFSGPPLDYRFSIGLDAPAPPLD